MVLYLVQLPPHLTKFQEKATDRSNVLRQKVSFLAILGHFGAFSAIKEPLATQRELFSKIRECYIPPYEVVTPCKILEKYNSH